MSEQRPEKVAAEGREREEQYFKRPSGMVALWAGVLSGPAAWALSQQVAYLFATLDCSTARDLALSPVMLGAALLAVGGGFLSWRNWRLAGRALPGEEGGAIGRSRWMSVVGIVLSGYSLLVIIAQWLPVFFYRHCQR